MKSRRLSTFKAWSMDIYHFSDMPRLGLRHIILEKDSLTESFVWDLTGPPSSYENQSSKKPRDFWDGYSFIWLLTNRQHVRHHQPAPVLLLRRHFSPRHWSALSNLRDHKVTAWFSNLTETIVFLFTDKKQQVFRSSTEGKRTVAI